MEVSIVFISLFIVVFGICYLYYNTRHKERVLLIEKDKDVSLFYSKREGRNKSIVWKIVILNLGLISIGVGTGIIFGSILSSVFGMYEEPAIAASIFLMSGIALLIGFFLTKKMDQDN
ncbi:MAG: hypothetical protein HQ521_17950 [Bacteroidetes bacterium]|nr:hypothetical protein [Bacteroidota bacterium]